MRRVGVGAKPLVSKDESKLKEENKELKTTVKALTKENEELKTRIAELSSVGDKKTVDKSEK